MRSFKPAREPIALSEQLWRQQFKPDLPLCIEIGAGVGYHAIQYCIGEPNCNYVAIEKTREKFAKFQQRLDHHQPLTHLHAIHDNAIDWIASNIQPNEVDHYFILYPNPYPKAKQANKRFVAMPFMQYLVTTMKPGATVTLATNIESYYLDAKQCYQELLGLGLLQAEPVSLLSKPRTHFERKYLQRGETCYNLVCYKK